MWLVAKNKNKDQHCKAYETLPDRIVSMSLALQLNDLVEGQGQD